jgi:sulfate permease, SulP family
VTTRSVARRLLLGFSFRPRLVDCLRAGYTGAQFREDLAAGLTVGVVALPLAMAFAIGSGVGPAAGIWTAIIAGFLISALGGSRVQIGGPTGAYIVIVYGIVAQYGVANLAICTLAAGALLFAMGALRMGGLIRFIPVSIVIGFTNGIAVLILLSQLKDFLGLKVALPDEFFTRIRMLVEQLPSADPITIALAFGSLCVLWFWPKAITTVGEALREESEQQAAQRADGAAHPTERDRAFVHTTRRGRALLARFPGPIAIIIVASLVVAAFGLNVETIGSRFGGIPQGLPSFVLPTVTLETLRYLASPTITIALLGAIESLLSARVADSQIGDRHDSNQELMAQGVANMVVPFFGGIPATGAIARTATNVRAGGRTPVAGIVHALTLLAVVLVAAPLAKFVPLAALSAVLIIVALNMGDWQAFRELGRYSLPYRAVLLATFVITVVFDLTLAVEIGLVLSSLFFIWRVTDLTQVERIALDDIPAGISAWKLFGSLFFGTVGKLDPLFVVADKTGQVVILEMHQVISVDSTGIDTLQSLARTLTANGGTLIFCGLTRQPEAAVRRSGFAERLGAENVVGHLAAAIIRAHAIAGQRGISVAKQIG